MNNRQKCWIQHKAKQKSIASASGCIEWIGTKNKGGYGLIEYTDEITKKRHCLPVHRALFMINIGLELKRLQQVLHSCDNPSCINLKHLSLGTPKDNMDDCTKRNRRAKKHKYHHRHKKYDDDLINKIRESILTPTQTSRLYGVSYTYAYDIMHGKLKRPL